MRTHQLNVSNLVLGLIFLGLSGSWVLRETGVVDLGEVRWLMPLTLVVAGVIGLVAVAAKGLSRKPDTENHDDRSAGAYAGYQPSGYAGYQSDAYAAPDYTDTSHTSYTGYETDAPAADSDTAPVTGTDTAPDTHTDSKNQGEVR